MCPRGPLNFAVCIHCNQDIDKDKTLEHNCPKFGPYSPPYNNLEEKKALLIKSARETIDYYEKVLEDPMMEIKPKMQKVDFTTMQTTIHRPKLEIKDLYEDKKTGVSPNKQQLDEMNRQLAMKEALKEAYPVGSPQLERITNVGKKLEFEILHSCYHCNAMTDERTMVVTTFPNHNGSSKYCPSCWQDMKNGLKVTKKYEGQTNKEVHSSWDPEDDTFLEDA